MVARLGFATGRNESTLEQKHLDEHDKFHLVETRKLHSIWGYFFCHNRPGTRVSESLLDNQRESALFVVPEES